MTDNLGNIIALVRELAKPESELRTSLTTAPTESAVTRQPHKAAEALQRLNLPAPERLEEVTALPPPDHYEALLQWLLCCQRFAPDFTDPEATLCVMKLSGVPISPRPHPRPPTPNDDDKH